MQDKPISLYTRLGGYDAIAAVLTTCFRGCVRTNCSADFGRAHAALIPITASANWPLISSPQPQEGQLSTWAGT
jgi:hypothetical protein